MLEHLSADEDGEAHDAPNQRVESWEESWKAGLNLKRDSFSFV